jgi:hypothetical protein
MTSAVSRIPRWSAAERDAGGVEAHPASTVSIPSHPTRRRHQGVLVASTDAKPLVHAALLLAGLMSHPAFSRCLSRCARRADGLRGPRLGFPEEWSKKRRSLASNCLCYFPRGILWVVRSM